jgi:hypothetical protein
MKKPTSERPLEKDTVPRRARQNDNELIDHNGVPGAVSVTTSKCLPTFFDDEAPHGFS